MLGVTLPGVLFGAQIATCNPLQAKILAALDVDTTSWDNATIS